MIIPVLITLLAAAPIERPTEGFSVCLPTPWTRESRREPWR
jgi:hypothetical protein